ncbi:MAG: glutamate--cysteine ligase [Burkholderiales bacterium]|jgi:glutamate--cysteine ligase|nr:glutamate--cysteine ligase [Burkholderiales bacterium]
MSFAQRLASLGPDRLAGMRRGVEKESLRISPDGRLALTPHPQALGSALTHPRITTDFSESQLEFVTGVHPDAQACLAELTRIHQFVYRSIGEELLWVGSMPCRLPADETIPIGRYGTSNIGRAKSVYRMGLGLRYGRRMQTISGIHYNWSMPGLSNEQYFGLIRNFRRHSFLLLLLFGASPAVCASFVEGRDHGLQPLNATTYHLPHATSLRMGRLGYQSDAQAALAVSYNSLEDYAASLEGALTRPHPPYERLGVRNLGGEYHQLATSLLQIENEFYGTIRPKRVIHRAERPLHALRQRGVEYIEVRCMDLDPFEPVGIAADTMRFLDVFLLHCLLADSPPDSPSEIARLAHNQHLVAARGRDPELTIEGSCSRVAVADWAREVMLDCRPMAEALDAGSGADDHVRVLESMLQRLQQPATLPSARVLEAMKRDSDGVFTAFVRDRSAATRAELLGLDLPRSELEAFQALASQSADEQFRLEVADALSFEVWRRSYLAPETLQV